MDFTQCVHKVCFELFSVLQVIEESQFPPVVTPLEVWVGVYQERWAGGELGRVSATDQDPYDSLEFALAPPTPPRLFTIDPRGGALAAAPGLDTGRYLLNVTVSDGKFTSSASVVVLVQPIWDDMLQHSVSIRSANLLSFPNSFEGIC